MAQAIKPYACDEFFDSRPDSGLTFDDVRLRPGASDYHPSEIDITGAFSRTIELQTPMVSAAMDTVTTGGMATAMAKLGGLGVIHAGLSVETQKREVRKVKLELNGLIENPITISPKMTVGELQRMHQERGFNFWTFPVVDKEGKFVGLVTENDVIFADGELDARIKDIMTPAADVKTASRKVRPHQAYETMRQLKKKTLPLVNRKGKVTGLYVFSDVNRIVQGNPEGYNLDENGRLRAAIAVPTDDGALERVEASRKYIDVVVVDTAQGDSKYARGTLRDLKAEYPDLDVVVGNISVPESAKLLVELGADGIKVGQGPGSICTTRIETGIGMPQVTAVYECARAIRGSGVPICADGGITNPGDIVIALAAGADSVMMGSKLAGTKEAPGEIRSEGGKMVKSYRGMGSPSALRDSAASRSRYNTEGAVGKPLAEGVESFVPFTGSVVDIIDHYIKALRKGMSYQGRSSLQNMHKKARFIQVTNAGMRESHPHDVVITTV